MTSIRNNLQQVQARIATACAAAGRRADSVELLAVSKTMPVAAVLEACAAGQRAFGENYVQEGVAKIQAVRAWEAESGAAPAAVQWHLIGPLQSNKTRLAATHFDWFHGVDRLKIAQRLSEQRPAELAPLQVCIQVNIDGGGNKSGVVPQEAAALAAAVAALPRLVLRGLMTVPEPVAGFAAQRAVHARAHEMFEQLRAGGGLGPAFDTLSMGMTADLEAAIAAGSTLVRVGTAIFGAR
ncbi:YggS family pyridoxal phosphate-dependent enzyme [Pseudorhodoferax sp.]|uniref:YggS family pyridoxal phosphate-dependent enzyme n=1 Tax=Pseudorhodoferax sp. TaxID=1993553 RepID=UPI0039E3559D